MDINIKQPFVTVNNSILKEIDLEKDKQQMTEVNKIWNKAQKKNNEVDYMKVNYLKGFKP